MNRGIRRYGITILFLGGTLFGSRVINNRGDEPLATPLESITMEIGGWQGESDPPIRADILRELLPSSYLSRTYRRASESVNLFVAYYANQHAGESMHSPRHCLPGGGWEFLSYSETDLRVPGGTIRVNRHTIQKDGAQMSVLYWYQSRRRVLANEYTAKLFLIRDAIVERKTGGSIVRIISSNTPAGQQAASDFAAAIYPELLRVIGRDEAVQAGGTL